MTNLGDISGTVAVVTGGSRGIGLAIARHFLRHGARVIVGGLDTQETAAAVKVLATESGQDRVAAQPGNVSSPETAEALVTAAFKRFGGLDTLVCNAGIDIIKPAVDYKPEEWDRILAVNLRGAFLPAQQAARAWIERGQHGSVIMTSSIAARAGIAGLAPYGASKGGIDQLVRTLAVEWAKHGIRVNAVAPGYVDTTTFASLCFFAAILIASARLTFAFSKDSISFAVGNTSGSGARCATAGATANKMRSKRVLVLSTENLLP
jgi:NAD(P)-dependent dehydrogenase (short-subunit alcohol dehydrogenase family)